MTPVTPSIHPLTRLATQDRGRAHSVTSQHTQAAAISRNIILQRDLHREVGNARFVVKIIKIRHSGLPLLVALLLYLSHYYRLKYYRYEYHKMG